MITENNYSHVTYGKSVMNRVKDAGYKILGYVAENIFKGNGLSPQKALDGFIKSPGHNKNLLGSYSQMGSAYCKGTNGNDYWAQVFGNGFDDTTYDDRSCSYSGSSKAKSSAVPVIAAVNKAKQSQITRKVKALPPVVEEKKVKKSKKMSKVVPVSLKEMKEAKPTKKEEKPKTKKEPKTKQVEKTDEQVEKIDGELYQPIKKVENTPMGKKSLSQAKIQATKQERVENCRLKRTRLAAAAARK
jgi:hypothetical protein